MYEGNGDEKKTKKKGKVDGKRDEESFMREVGCQ